MHLNPASTFWVWETAGHLPLLKSPQYYDASTGKLHKATDDTPHYRLTMVYYDKEENNDVSD